MVEGTLPLVQFYQRRTGNGKLVALCGEISTMKNMKDMKGKPKEYGWLSQRAMSLDPTV